MCNLQVKLTRTNQYRKKTQKRSKNIEIAFLKGIDVVNSYIFVYTFSVQISGHHGMGGGGRVIVSKLCNTVIDYNCQQLSVVCQSVFNQFILCKYSEWNDVIVGQYCNERSFGSGF